MDARRLTNRLYATPALSVAECEDIVRRGDALGYTPAPIISSAGPVRLNADIRRADRIVFAQPPGAGLDALGLGPAPARLFGLARRIDEAHLRTGFTCVQSLQLIRYSEGGYYSWHRDSRDPAFRKVSLIAYLDDPASGSFEGGDTVFARNRVMKHLRPTALAPRRGEAVVFDSRMQHRATRLTRGQKHVLLMMFV